MKQSTRNHPGSSGFTMTELLMVVVVIAILAGIAIPAFSVWMPNYRLKRAARDLYSTMQSVKMAAVKNNQNMNITFSAAPHQYQYSLLGVNKTVLLADYGSGVRFRNWNDTETFTAAPSPLTFDGRGFTNVAVGTDFNVFLGNQNNREFYCVRLSSTGAIRLLKSNGTATYN